MRFLKDIRLWLLGIVFLTLGALLVARVFSSPESDLSPREELATEQTVAPPLEPSFPHRLAKNSSLYASLRELDVPAPTIHAMAASAKPVFDLSRLRTGTEYRLDQDPSSKEPIAIEFRLSPTERLMVKKISQEWKAEKHQEVVETRTVTFKGLVSSSLWESAEAAQMDPDMIVQLAEIFAWEVDFAREVRKNDRWRISVEQKQVRGKTIGWGPILAAEYENQGELHTAVLFQDGDSSAYYSADGSNLRRMFLKSPIKYGRISSRFNLRRFHPIHKVRRPHRGVDYAAAVGTPIRAVGHGTITLARWSGGGGKTVKIRHNSTYQTAYLHMSRFEKGIRPGVKVKQGQIIGFVGTTGLSTGPHLHFEFAYNGRVVDPLKQKFPSADPVSKDNLARFKAHASTAFSGLPPWEEANVAARDPVSVRLLKGLAPREAQAEEAATQR